MDPESQHDHSGGLRAAVILNPIKVGDADEFRAKVDTALSERGFDASLWLETTEDDAGYAIADRAIDDIVDLVVVAGGDGTVRVVCAELARTDIPVADRPAGTGNLLGRAIGWCWPVAGPTVSRLPRGSAPPMAATY